MKTGASQFYKMSFSAEGLLLNESLEVAHLHHEDEAWPDTIARALEDRTIHARHIVTDNGWKIFLDRSLDIFQRYEMNVACPRLEPTG